MVRDEDSKEDGCALTVEQLVARSVLEMAKDKYQTRTLQRSLAVGGPEVVQHILGEVTPDFLELVQDQYANYTCQKLLEVVSAEQFDALFGILEGHLRDLVSEVHGSRTVQRLVEQAIARGRVSELLAALPLDLQDMLARSMTGFHVVVKLVENLPSEEVELLLDRLCGTPEKASELGSDQWGCCVLKKCLDRATGSTKDRLVGAVTSMSLPLVQDQYGNYVVQHLLIKNKLGFPPISPHATDIIDALKGQIFDLCQHKFSSNVLEKCLLHSGEQDRNKIVNEILSPPSCPPSEGVRMLIFHQYGNYVFQQALEVSKEPQFSLLVEHAKVPVQDVVRAVMAGEPPPDPEDGNLPVLQCRRLAAKLVKKYPPLAQGLDMDLLGGGMWDAHSWDPGVYAADCFGAGAFGMGDWAPEQLTPATLASMWEQNFGGYPMGQWDPGFGVYPAAHPPPRGRGGRGGKGGKQGKGGKGKAPGGGACGGMPVGRIVGFWPNYRVTYDEVPAQAGKGRGGRGRTKSRGRSGQAAKADVAAAAAPGHADAGT